ncbi:MAG TPA: hypothetical protein VKZ63_22165 [Kofleriaceae bacterium]|nr:hypothetical protein [Kofleriaceae bacterium]
MSAIAPVALAAILLASCGPARPAESAETTALATPAGDAGSQQQGDIASPPAPGCPQAWAAITDGDTCSAQDSPQSCDYPEGSCWCGVAPRCSGVAPHPDEERAAPTVWNCTPTPPEVRSDGCPGSEPESGSPCADEGKECHYGDCCITRVECTGGAWKQGTTSCPP